MYSAYNLNNQGDNVTGLTYFFAKFESVCCSIIGHLSCSHVLATVNSPPVIIGVNVSCDILVVSRYMPTSGIAGSYVSSIFSF